MSDERMSLDGGRIGSMPRGRKTPIEDLPEFLSPDEFRGYVDISRSTVYDLLRKAEIPFVRFGRCIRIPKAALRRAPTGVE